MESPAEIDGDRVKGFRRRVCVCVWLRERNRESYARRRRRRRSSLQWFMAQSFGGNLFSLFSPFKFLFFNI